MAQETDLKTKCAESLKNLSGSLNVQNKKDAAKNCNVHYNTVLNYLRGEIGDVDTGLKLVEFFNKILNEKMNRVRKILSA